MQQALRLLEADAPETAARPPEQTLPLAWALKDLCYRAWASQPARAAQAADVLSQLNTQGLGDTQMLEVQGLRDWTRGIACITRGQMAEAVACFDLAAGALHQAGQPDPAAQTQVPKIMALTMLGQHEEARACAEAAQRELLALGNLNAASRVSLNLGSMLMQRDAYGPATTRYREAAVLFARQGDHLHSVLADIGLAAALTSLGDVDEGLRIYARARMRATQHQLLQPLAMVQESVALVDLSRGRYREALAGLEAARQSFETLGLPHALAIAEKQLADAYLDLRLLPEALALFDTALSQFVRLDMPDEQARALAQRGRALALLGQSAAAGANFADASTLFEACGNVVGQSEVRLALAELALAQGHSQLALQGATDAGTGFVAAGHADGRSRADAVRAQSMWAAGQHAQADLLYASTLRTARELEHWPVQVRCLTGQGLSALTKGQTSEAERAFESAIELLEDQRRALPGDDMRAAFLTDQLRPYQERLRMALQTGDAIQVLVQLERSRARSLSDHQNEGPGRDDTAGEEEAALRERLHWLIRHVQRQHDDGETSATLDAERVWTERELLERARRRRLAAPTQDAAATATFAVNELQTALTPGDALVEYGVTDDEVFAVVVTHAQVVLLRQLTSWATCCQALQSARFQIETLRHGQAPVAQHLPAILARTQSRLQALHRLLWAPLQTTLAGCQRVLIVPHAQLSAVPFAALLASDQPLGQSLQLALVPSARAALRGLQRPPAPVRTALALGDGQRLAHAGQEACRVAALFPQGQAFVGDQASLHTLMLHGGGADVLHLACHAQFRSDNPRFSALYLHDGALTVERVESLRLRAGLVVLSACESGVADEGRGNEMVGLVRAFLLAGASRVMGTLWPVDDEVTANFMAAFYTALVGGQTPSLALQTAQTQLRQQHPSPYFWAPYTLYGGW